MMPRITLTTREQELEHLLVVTSKMTRLPGGLFSASEKKYMHLHKEQTQQELFQFNRYDYWVFVCLTDQDKDLPKRLEKCRKHGEQVAKVLNAHKASKVAIYDAEGLADETLAVAEGMALGSYQFLKFKSDKKELNTLQEIEIYAGKESGYRIAEKPTDAAADENSATSPRIDLLNAVIQSVALARDLINEPNSHLNATQFAERVTEMAKTCGASVDVLEKPKIEALRMGGLLGVNQGSHHPPTFTVMEWKPENAVNARPVILVGKGVMYDTGGMNLKPGDTMLNMKDDMSGAAAVAATIHAVAAAKLPVNVIGLMPATDNRPGEKALVSGDIITMHSGLTVEVLNTDAEGRLILADALSYAGNYDPMLVIDLATLTGAAVRAIGKFGAVAMHAGAAEFLEQLKKSGDHVYERLAEFPMWEEYGEQIKSDLADLKNLGPPEAGMITAAKFLERFTKYPYIHLDIAGPSFLEKPDSYRGQGGTGFGVRLLVAFLEEMVRKQS